MSLSTRFPAFGARPFRRYAVGQFSSMGGTWLQAAALAWLVLELTDDGRAVGLIGFAQFLPPLFFGAWSGSVADRVDVRKAVLVMQVLLGIQAVTLAVLVFTHHATVPRLLGLVAFQGCVSAFDPPIRQSMVNRIVGDDLLSNAIATNSAMVHLGAIVGPAIAGVLIAKAGTEWCFVVNAVSYLIMFLAIRSIRPSEIAARHSSDGQAGVAAGLQRLAAQPDLFMLLGIVVLVATFAGRLEVLTPLLAKKDLGGGSGLFSWMNIMRGVGALMASLWLAARSLSPSMRTIRGGAVVLAASLGAMALPIGNNTERSGLILVALVPAGGALMLTIVATLSMTQLGIEPAFRGRVVAAWFVALNLGMVVGSPLTGWISEVAGTSTTLVIGALSAVCIAALSHANLIRQHANLNPAVPET
jgi:MFS family permease